MASQKNLKIKTGTLRRVFKELKSYEKELESEVARTEKMKADGADSHDLKQQVRSIYLLKKADLHLLREDLNDTLLWSWEFIGIE